MNRLQTIPRFSLDYRAGDFLAAAGKLFCTQPPSLEPVETIFGDRPRFWASSGRQALWLILKALKPRTGAGVAIPLYCDLSVADAVKHAGCTPVFVDVEEATLTMDPKSLMRVRSQISAVVVPHFFGHVADMAQILEVAGPIPVIEDTAHAPFSFLGDRMTGSFGVACFYSFGSTKPWPAGGGGLAVVNDPVLTPNVSSLANTLASHLFQNRCRNLVGQGAKAILLRRPFYGLFGRTIRSHAERHKLLEPEFDRKTIQPHQAAIVLRQTKRLDEWVKRQQANSHRLLSLLSGVEDVILPRERPGVRFNYHMFPVLLSDPEEKQAVATGMLRRNVDTSQLYWKLVEGAYSLGYRGGCPVSESVSGRMLTLPNNSHLSDDDIDTVAEVFLEALKAYRLTKPPTGTRSRRDEQKRQAVTR